MKKNIIIQPKSIMKLYVNPLLTEEEAEKLSGGFVDITHCNIIIDYDCDVYDRQTGKPIMKFRKNAIDDKTCNVAFDNLKKKSQDWANNRGASAGSLSVKDNIVWNKTIVDKDGKPIDPNIPRYSAHYLLKDGRVSARSISVSAQSNAIGFYDTGRPPCRETTFTRNQVGKWKRSIPFIREVDKVFKKAMPREYSKQYNFGHMRSELMIADTAFSTVTINWNFRTAVHKDVGDYRKGFGVLAILEEGEYAGGYTIFPRYGIAFDARQGDVVMMNVHMWHCNSEMRIEGGVYAPNAPKHTATKDGGRLACVFYLREKIPLCPAMKKETKHYVVAVLTYKRYEMFKKQTHKFLLKRKVPPDKIYVFVADEDEKLKYEEVLEEGTYKEIIVGVPGAAQQREFISDYFDEGQFIVYADDDCKDLTEMVDKKSSTRVGNVDAFIRYMFSELIKNNLYIWGVSAVDNPFFMNAGLSTNLKFIVGVFYGIINRKTATFLNPFNGEPENLKCSHNSKDDILQTLKYFLCDGGVLRCNYVAPKTKYWDVPGGMTAFMPDRKSKALEDCKWLKEHYPKMIIKTRTKKNGHSDVLLNYRYRTKACFIKQDSTQLGSQEEEVVEQ